MVPQLDGGMEGKGEERENEGEGVDAIQKGRGENVYDSLRYPAGQLSTWVGVKPAHLLTHDSTVKSQPDLLHLTLTGRLKEINLGIGQNEYPHCNTDEYIHEYVCLSDKSLVIKTLTTTACNHRAVVGKLCEIVWTKNGISPKCVERDENGLTGHRKERHGVTAVHVDLCHVSKGQGELPHCLGEGLVDKHVDEISEHDGEGRKGGPVTDSSDCAQEHQEPVKCSGIGEL